MDNDPVAEEYVKTVYLLEEQYSRRVRTVEIAEAVEKTQATTTHMIQKLSEEEYLDYIEYKGVRATEQGEELALRLIRKHRLIETFLAEQLDLPWSNVHSEASHLEHHISDELADRLAAFLGHPRTDPHGDPIPDAQLQLPENSETQSLADCDTGEQLAIKQVPDREVELREYLFENGLGPGTTVEIDDVSPVGIIKLDITGSDRNVTVPDHAARQVMVESSESSTEQEI